MAIYIVSVDALAKLFETDVSYWWGPEGICFLPKIFFSAMAIVTVGNVAFGEGKTEKRSHSDIAVMVTSGLICLASYYAVVPVLAILAEGLPQVDNDGLKFIAILSSMTFNAYGPIEALNGAVEAYRASSHARRDLIEVVDDLIKKLKAMDPDEYQEFSDRYFIRQSSELEI